MGNVFGVYLGVTLLAAGVNGMAAVANLVGHDYPLREAERLRVPRGWTLPLGLLLGAGALGLVVGIGVPGLGTAAAGGLVVYFLGALNVHLRVRDWKLGAWGLFFALAVGALAVNLAYHGV
ncbi:DoxX family protein [Streptomyces sp. ODS28]|uniref:DoxX family protein n=1 Tax=Streptomyces sp. ODS28 TaxID=3136688 RepID=UPI0031EE9FFA